MSPVYFSIIIPHKNIPKLLSRCLLSIPAKDDIEVIVVDDNSDTEHVDFNNFPSWNGKNYKCIFTKDGKGAGYARNIGLSKASGKYIVFADADDWFVPEMYEILSEIKDSLCDCHHYKIDSFNTTTGKQGLRHMNRNNSIDAYLQHEVSDKIAATWHTAVTGQVYLRDFILHNNIKFDEIVICNDTMFAVKSACLSETLCFHDQVLYVISENDFGLHRSKCLSVDRYVLMQRVNLNVQRYCEKHNVYKPKMCMLKVIKDTYVHFGVKGFYLAFKMAISERAVFNGLYEYLRRKI